MTKVKGLSSTLNHKLFKNIYHYKKKKFGSSVDRNAANNPYRINLYVDTVFPSNAMILGRFPFMNF
jgi:hypothetical protein